MRIFFSVGEPSGDQHAAHLIDELRQRQPDFQAVGYGGPAMRAAGCALRFELTTMAVMGFLRVIPLLGQFIRLARAAGREFRDNPPDAVVLVDFPGFNWWIARSASRAGVPVFYYMPPQLWAWAPWRIRRVRKYVSHVLCALSFEHDWYASRGVRATYVGHPFFDEVAAKRLDAELVSGIREAGPTLAVLPGSRRHEVERNFPIMLEAARRLSREHPRVRFAVACYNAEQRHLVEEILNRAADPPEMQMHVGCTSEIIEAADCCMLVSGSVSLELLARRTPGVVLYRLTRLHTTLRPLVIRCRYITLPNLMADAEVMPEFVSSGNPQPTVESLYSALDKWFREPRELARARRQLGELADSVVITGATARAADVILNSNSHNLNMPARRIAS